MGSVLTPALAEEPCHKIKENTEKYNVSKIRTS